MSTARQQKLDEIARRFRERLEAAWATGESDATGVKEIVARIKREVLR